LNLIFCDDKLSTSASQHCSTTQAHARFTASSSGCTRLMYTAIRTSLYSSHCMVSLIIITWHTHVVLQTHSDVYMCAMNVFGTIMKIL
jgi:hypothetical protein